MLITGQRIVVEHLLEVRREPALVHRVAGEPAAQVIVDAALAELHKVRIEETVDWLLREMIADGGD